MDNYVEKKKKAFLVCCILLMSALNGGWLSWSKPLDNHECFVSITAREMLARNDFVWPTCNGEPRLQKTPLSYWLVAGASKITGRIDEFTTRLPSIIAAILSTVAILYFLNKWLCFRTAVVSAGVWATTLAYIRYAHSGRPDMVLTFFVVLCFLSFYGGLTASNRKRQVAYMLIFWASLGIANLAKGPAPVPFVLLPLFIYVAVFRKWKTLPKLLPVIGPIIFLAITLPWPLAIAGKLNWDLVVWKREFIYRFLGEYASGHKHFYYYLPRMFQFALPWAAFVPMALAAPFYRIWNKKQPLMYFMWFWFVVGLVFITISGGKRQHYILPFMPAMAVLIGIIVDDMAFERKCYPASFVINTLKAHIAVLIFIAVAGPVFVFIKGSKALGYSARSGFSPAVYATALGLVVVILALAVVWLFWKRKPAYACGTVFGGITVFVVVTYATIFIPLNYNRYSRDFSKRIRQIVPPSSELVAYEYISDRSVQYFGRIIPVEQDISQLYKRYERGAWVVATAGHMEKIDKDGRFRRVYYKEKAERRRQDDAGGALYHKSAKILGSEL